jgi:anti-sigma B factor antagonist
MPQDPLIIDEICGPNHRILRLKGPLLVSNLFEFQSRVRANTLRFLILDFTEVPYVDSAGIGALVGAYVNHQNNDRSLALVGVNQRVRGAMQTTHVESLFRFHATMAAAEESVA